MIPENFNIKKANIRMQCDILHSERLVKHQRHVHKVDNDERFEMMDKS